MAKALVPGVAVLVVSLADAQDWSQWRGDNRDGKASEFSAPATWPKELTKKWEVSVGNGTASPSLVGDRLYVFSRQDGNEVARCLDAVTGDELWNDSYETEGVTGAARGFPGPRSTPTVADGKVVTLGVRGMLSCLDAATGNVRWRKNDFVGQWPTFYVASSPIVVDGLCIAELGGRKNGAIVAYDLDTGEEKWRVLGENPSYASPMQMTVGGTKLIVAPTANSLVAVTVADGKLLWKIPFTQGRYNAATPAVAGQTLILGGPGSGMSAIALEQVGDELAEEQLWTNTDNNLQFSSPVLKDGLVYAVSANDTLFCINLDTHGTAWSAPVGGAAQPEGGPLGPAAGRGRAGRRGRGGGRAGYGSIVDLGAALLALTPASELVVYAPSATEFKELARYKVSETPTYAYPIVSGKRIYTKDQDSLVLWTVE